mmetsp:Transcript_1520/g.3656  ORF Transcript_1520/g.3656 Transcript_1520/m.3656 type:complete len:263 (-) Transcript_1520:6-794(-)
MGRRSEDRWLFGQPGDGGPARSGGFGDAPWRRAHSRPHLVPAPSAPSAAALPTALSSTALPAAPAIPRALAAPAPAAIPEGGLGQVCLEMDRRAVRSGGAARVNDLPRSAATRGAPCGGGAARGRQRARDVWREGGGGAARGRDSRTEVRCRGVRRMARTTAGRHGPSGQQHESPARHERGRAAAPSADRHVRAGARGGCGGGGRGGGSAAGNGQEARAEEGHARERMRRGTQQRLQPNVLDWAAHSVRVPVLHSCHLFFLA